MLSPPVGFTEIQRRKNFRYNFVHNSGSLHQKPALSSAFWKVVLVTKYSFGVDVHGEDISFSSNNPGFITVDYKPDCEPKLVLLHRTYTDESELLASGRQRTKKARELSRIE